jgi:hypothetical protein
MHTTRATEYGERKVKKRKINVYISASQHLCSASCIPDMLLDHKYINTVGIYCDFFDEMLVPMTQIC